MRKRERTGERGKLLRPRCRPDPQEKRQERKKKCMGSVSDCHAVLRQSQLGWSILKLKSPIRGVWILQGKACISIPITFNHWKRAAHENHDSSISIMLDSEHAARTINQLTFLQQKISVAHFHDYLSFLVLNWCFIWFFPLSSTYILIVFMWEKNERHRKQPNGSCSIEKYKIWYDNSLIGLNNYKINEQWTWWHSNKNHPNLKTEKKYFKKETKTVLQWSMAPLSRIT